MGKRGNVYGVRKGFEFEADGGAFKVIEIDLMISKNNTKKKSNFNRRQPAFCCANKR